LKQPPVRQHVKAPKNIGVLGSGRPTGATGIKRARTHY
jgi:hypothetical protein